MRHILGYLEARANPMGPAGPTGPWGRRARWSARSGSPLGPRGPVGLMGPAGPMGSDGPGGFRWTPLRTPETLGQGSGYINWYKPSLPKGIKKRKIRGKNVN